MSSFYVNFDSYKQFYIKMNFNLESKQSYFNFQEVKLKEKVNLLIVFSDSLCFMIVFVMILFYSFTVEEYLFIFLELKVKFLKSTICFNTFLLFIQSLNIIFLYFNLLIYSTLSLFFLFPFILKTFTSFYFHYFFIIFNLNLFSIQFTNAFITIFNLDSFYFN